MPMMIHPLADVHSTHIGEGTNVWQYCVILRGARIGRGCKIGSHVFIANDVEVGDNVTINNGVQIWDGMKIESDVFIGPNVTFLKRQFSSGGGNSASQIDVTIESGASIGANATIANGITIGAGAVIRPGSVVAGSVPPAAIVECNPASIVGYVDTETESSDAVQYTIARNEGSVDQTPVRGVSIYRFPIIADLRGDLTVGEFSRQIPFKPLRYFMVFGVPSKEIRGEHAHFECHQFLICVHGSCAVVADDGSRRVEVTLDAPNVGVHLPPMTWGVQYKYTKDAILLVFASDYYNPDDYIRDYLDFLKLSKYTK